TSLPPFHSPAFDPSNRTTAPAGGLAPSVGLWRTTWSRVKASPSAVLPVNVGLLSRTHLPVQPLPPGGCRTVLRPRSLSVAAGTFTFVFPSQPAPGSPPGRK